jgi:hypothetical protein
MSAALFNLADQILRNEAADPAQTMRLRRLVPLVTVSCLIHGLCVGCFGVDSHKLLQPLYSSLKLPLLGFSTFALSIPCFFVFHTILGLREDFLPAMRAIVFAQASAAMALVSLSPVVLVFYSATSDYQLAVLFNAFVFFAATLGGLPQLRRAYRPLIQKNPLHRRLMLAWLLAFAFVGIQMGWVLRPFIGAPGQKISFFRTGDWDNAFIVIGRLIWHAIH